MHGNQHLMVQPVLDSLTAHVAIIDRAGIIVLTNRAWNDFARANGGEANPSLGIGADYLQTCRNAQPDLTASSVMDGILSVLAGEVATYEIEYPCHAADELRWFLMQATPLDIDGERHALILHQNVTQLRQGWTADESERTQASQVQSSTDELESLERLSRGAPTTLTARSFGLVRLSEGMPQIFEELVARYASVLDLALEQRTYKVRHPISPELRWMAERLGFSRAGPRDIIDIHTVALRTKLRHGPKVTQAYFEESRALLLELMGYLVSYYRTYATGPGAPTAGVPASQVDSSDREQP